MNKKEIKNIIENQKSQMNVITNLIRGEDMTYEERSVADFDESEEGNWNRG